MIKFITSGRHIKALFNCLLKLKVINVCLYFCGSLVVIIPQSHLLHTHAEVSFSKDTEPH